jgi:hypothetical protein
VAVTVLRRCTAVIALFVAASVLLLTAVTSPALADPDEGGSKTLRDALESAAKGQVVAKQKLVASQKRQTQLQATVKQSEAAAKALETQVATIANRSYRLGRTSTMTMLLESGSPDVFLERAERLDMMAQIDGGTLARYQGDLTRARQAKAAIDREIREQQKQVAALTKKKKEAELALASVGGGSVAGGFINANSPLAKPAPRNSDGSWPKESCTVDDPTTSGCITPRLLNAYQQARRPASSTTRRASASAPPASIRRAGPATSRPTPRRSRTPRPPAATRRTATAWPRTSSRTPTASACCT